MADPTGIEAHQARLGTQVQETARTAVICHALRLLDPTRDLTQVSYREALVHLEAACAAERQRLDAAERRCHGPTG